MLGVWREELGQGGTAGGLWPLGDQSQGLQLQRGAGVGAAHPAPLTPGLPTQCANPESTMDGPILIPTVPCGRGARSWPPNHTPLFEEGAGVGGIFPASQTAPPVARVWGGERRLSPRGGCWSCCPRAAAPGGCLSRHPQKASQHRTPFIIPGPSDLSNKDQLLSAISKGCQTLRESAGGPPLGAPGGHGASGRCPRGQAPPLPG